MRQVHEGRSVVRLARPSPWCPPSKRRTRRLRRRHSRGGSRVSGLRAKPLPLLHHHLMQRPARRGLRGLFRIAETEGEGRFPGRGAGERLRARSRNGRRGRAPALRSTISTGWLSGWAASPIVVAARCRRCQARPAAMALPISRRSRTRIMPSTGACVCTSRVMFSQYLSAVAASWSGISLRARRDERRDARRSRCRCRRDVRSPRACRCGTSARESCDISRIGDDALGRLDDQSMPCRCAPSRRSRKTTRTSLSETSRIELAQIRLRDRALVDRARDWYGGSGSPRTADRGSQAPRRATDAPRARASFAGRRLKPPAADDHVHRIAADGSGAHQVLDRAADAQMHLAPEGIEAAQIARAVGEHRDRGAVRREQPGLGVVRIGGEDRGVQRLPGAFVAASAPFLPGLEGGALADLEHAAVPGAIAERPPARPNPRPR